MEATPFVERIKKRLILDYRSAKSGAKTIIYRDRLRDTIKVVGPTVGVQSVVIMVLVGLAMERVGSRISDDRNLTARGFTEGGIRVVGGYAEFVHRVLRHRHYWRDGSRFAVWRVVVVRTFQVARSISTIYIECNLFAA